MGAEKLHPQKNDSIFDADDEHDEAPAKKVEEGEGPWLVSYADLMTLLMGFFALISSFSSVDQKEFEKVKESASEAFGGEYQTPYKELGEALEKFIKESGLEEQVQIKVSASGVELTFTGTLFFDSGDFVVKPEAADLMSQLAAEIKKLPQNYKALIEGHTDSAPIRHPIIASNWELSGLRASRVAQLLEKNGFNKESLTIIGWGETRPLLPDTDKAGQAIPENMAKNRRVIMYIYDPKQTNDPVRR